MKECDGPKLQGEADANVEIVICCFMPKEKSIVKINPLTICAIFIQLFSLNNRCIQAIFFLHKMILTKGTVVNLQRRFMYIRW